MGASANKGSGVLVFYNGGEDWSNESITATFKGVNGSVFYLNFRDQMTVANHSRYSLQFDLGSGALRLLKNIQVGTGPTTATQLGSASYALSLNVWYTVGITADGGAIGVTINGSPVLSSTDPTPLLFGTIGVENDDVHGAFRIGSVSVDSTIPPQATWQQLGGPDGGQIQAIDIDPSNPNIIYAGAVHTGVTKSDNKGDFWREVGFSNGLTGTKANVVAIAPSNSSIVYASLEDSSTGGGASRSDDAGLHWRPLSQGLTGYFVSTLAVDPTNPNIVYIATENLVGSTLPVGLEKSTDGGSTWVQKNQGLTYLNLTTVAINPSDTNMILVGTGHRPYGGTVGGGIFKSTDGGNTWHKVSIPDYPVDSIVINPASTNTMYAATFGGGVYKSTDSGETWSQSNSGIGNNDVYALAIDPQQPDTLYAGINPFYANPTGPETDLAVFKTTDGAATWKNVLLDTDVEWIMLDPANPNHVFEGDHGGYISWSLDGGTTWSYGTDMIRKVGGHAYMWGSTVDPGVDALLVGTCGRGVFINHLSSGETHTPIWLKLQYKGAPYNAIFESDSSLPDFRFDTTSGSLTFTISGPAATRAVSNVTVPTALLTGPFTITLDGSPLTPLSTTTVASKGVTEIVVGYTQSGSNQKLVVTGTLQARTVTTTSTSSSTSTATSATSASTGTTSSLTSTVPSSSSSTTPATTASSQATTPSTAQTGGGGIPEFPFQIMAVTIFTLILFASYLVARRHATVEGRLRRP